LKILIADDDSTSRMILESILINLNHEVIVTSDGKEAWEELNKPDSPHLAILDWNMPEMEGVEICRKLRQRSLHEQAYIILLTVRSESNDIVRGLDAGADDYICKPYDKNELRARIDVGQRILGLQSSLSKRVSELEEAVDHIKDLQHVLPLCSYCKKIRDDKDYWEQLEGYFAKHSQTRFSHSICPECYEKEVKPNLENYKKQIQHDN
jgi:phosphoserine phosphatase RsbU/P